LKKQHRWENRGTSQREKNTKRSNEEGEERKEGEGRK
jgi:hypothetical protein